jgi:hypothetical protein
MDLFRKEAIEAQGVAPAVQVAPPPHLPPLLFWSAVLMSLASLAAGIASGAYQPDATVAGQVSDRVSFQVLPSPVSGYVKTVAARAGQVAEPGSLLMVIDREGRPSGASCEARWKEAGTGGGDRCDVSITGLLVPRTGAEPVGKGNGAARPACQVPIEMRTKNPWLTRVETIGPSAEIVGVLPGHAPWAKRL